MTFNNTPLSREGIIPTLSALSHLMENLVFNSQLYILRKDTVCLPSFHLCVLCSVIWRTWDPGEQISPSLLPTGFQSGSAPGALCCNSRLWNLFSSSKNCCFFQKLPTSVPESYHQCKKLLYYFPRLKMWRLFLYSFLDPESCKC